MSIGNVIVVTGQSNALNFGDGTGTTPFPGGWVTDAGIQIWNGSSFVTYVPLTNSNGDYGGSFWGPEAQYCLQRRQTFPSQILYIVKHALGNTGLAEKTSGVADFNPYSSANDTAKEFPKVISSIKAATKALLNASITPVIDTILICNGETDTLIQADADVFLTNQTLFIELIRDLTNTAKAIMMRPFPNNTNGVGLNTVRSAIETIGALSNNAFVNTDDLQNTTTPNAGHLLAPSVVTLGARMFSAYQILIQPIPTPPTPWTPNIMGKVSLSTVGNLQDTTTAGNTINTNSNVIVTGFNNTLSLDGTQPNQMGSNLDMNSNRILNLAAPASALEPVRLQDMETFSGGGTITVNPLPAGGTSAQVLTKNSSTNYDASWHTLTPSVSAINIFNYPTAGTYTYTPTANCRYSVIECWGAGGGGGGCAIAGSNISAGGGGGGAGSYSRKTFLNPTTQTVTVGAGGTAGAAGNNSGGTGGNSGVGSICFAYGGVGGGGSTGAGSSFSAGGSGGAFGVGDLTGTGASGGVSVAVASTAGLGVSGFGASTSVYGGAVPNVGAGSFAGVSGLLGSGGSGGTSNNASAASAGGAGGGGYVTITEFIQ